MKSMLLLITLCFLSACKIEKAQQAPAPELTLNDDQIALDSSEANSADINRFVKEIEERQEQDPDKVFEVVRTNQRTSSTILSAASDGHLYPNKNFYIFIGLGTEERSTPIKKTDWEAIYKIMDYVAEKKFRVLINIQATAEHLRIAAEDSETSVILWSSHGNPESFTDHKGQRVPFDIFKNKSPNFYQFILSSCNGRLALNKNYDYQGLVTYAWSGTTTSVDLATFLVSDDWSIEEGKILTTPIKGMTCTAKGRGFQLMNEVTRKGSGSYSTLKECQKKLNTL